MALFTRVQAGISQGGWFTNPTYTFSSANTSGNLIIVELWLTGPGSPSISDTAGNSYSLLVSQTASWAPGSPAVYLFACLDCKAASTGNIVTPSFTGAQGIVGAAEYHSINGGTWAFDTGLFTTGPSQFPYTGSINTSFTNEVVISMYAQPSSGCNNIDPGSNTSGNVSWNFVAEQYPTGPGHPDFAFSTCYIEAHLDVFTTSQGTVSMSILNNASYVGLILAGFYISSPIQADCSGLGTGTTGVYYNGQITFTGASLPVCVAAVNPGTNPLPPGLIYTVFTATSYVGIFGMPLQPGNFTFTLNITDSKNNYFCVTCTITIIGSDLSCPCGTATDIRLIMNSSYTSAATTEQGPVVQYGFPSGCNENFGCDLVGSPFATLYFAYPGIKNTNSDGNGGVPFSMYGVSSPVCGNGAYIGWTTEIFVSSLTPTLNDPNSPLYQNPQAMISSLNVGATNAGSLFWDSQQFLSGSNPCCGDSAVLYIWDIFVVITYTNGGLAIFRPNYYSCFTTVSSGVDVCLPNSSDPCAAGVHTSRIDNSTGHGNYQDVGATCSGPNQFCYGSVSHSIYQWAKGSTVVPGQLWFWGFIGPTKPAPLCPPAACTLNFANTNCLDLICGSGSFQGTIGVFYQGNVTAIGGTYPYTYQLVKGSFPPGINFDSGTGFYTGIPTATGEYDFTIKVTDMSSPTRLTALANCTVIICNSSGCCVPNCPPPSANQGGWHIGEN